MNKNSTQLGHKTRDVVCRIRRTIQSNETHYEAYKFNVKISYLAKNLITSLTAFL